MIGTLDGTLLAEQTTHRSIPARPVVQRQLGRANIVERTNLREIFARALNTSPFGSAFAQSMRKSSGRAQCPLKTTGNG
jgi:hypothetical protein